MKSLCEIKQVMAVVIALSSPLCLLLLSSAKEPMIIVLSRALYVVGFYFQWVMIMSKCADSHFHYMCLVTSVTYG